jgi:phospholipase C
MPHHQRSKKALAFLAVASLCACATQPVDPATKTAADPISRALRAKVSTIVVIYAENRAFDDLFGNFPGAEGLAQVVGPDGRPLPAYFPQRDRDGTVLPTLPQTWGGVTAPGYTPVVTQAESAGLPNAPFSIEHAFTAQSGVTLTTSVVTRDLWHRFFEHQMQIDGGKNDGYAAWADSGGLTMGHYDYSGSALFALARQYVLRQPRAPSVPPISRITINWWQTSPPVAYPPWRSTSRRATSISIPATQPSRTEMPTSRAWWRSSKPARSGRTW